MCVATKVPRRCNESRRQLTGAHHLCDELTLHHHYLQFRRTCERISRFPGASSAEQNCNQKHRLATLLHSATEGRANTSGSESAVEIVKWLVRVSVVCCWSLVVGWSVGCCCCCCCCFGEALTHVFVHTRKIRKRARLANNSCTTRGLTPGSSTPGVNVLLLLLLVLLLCCCCCRVVFVVVVVLLSCCCCCCCCWLWVVVVVVVVRKNAAIRAHVDEENVCNSSKKRQDCRRTCNQCRTKHCARVAPGSPEKSKGTPQATPRRTSNDCQIQGRTRRNNAQSSKCEQRRQE